MASAATSHPLPDRFIVLRNDRAISITPDRRKAEQMARHFKRLQPAATILIRDLAAEPADKH